MRLMNRDLPISISLSQSTYLNAERFAQAGFEACECVLPTFYREPVDLSVYQPFIDEVYPHVRAAGLKINAHHLPFGVYWDISSPDEEVRQGAVQANAALIRMLSGCEGSNVIIHPSFEPIPEEQREAHIDACQKSLIELDPVAADCGKRIALENLPRTCLGRTSEEMQRLTDDGRLCSVCMDTTHMFHETPQDFLRRCGQWVINTHLSDYLNGQDECHWVPGTGSLNWREIFESLAQLGYSGTYNFEVSKYAPLEILGGLTNALKRA